MKVICNEDILNDNKDILTANCETIEFQAIGGYKANSMSVTKELTQKPNEIHPETHVKNSRAIKPDIISKGQEDFEDEMTPFTVVAGSSFSVKSEPTDDEQSIVSGSTSELKNLLEVNTLQPDTMKVINIKEEMEFQSESKVKIDIKEENDFCELGHIVAHNALIKKSLQIFSGAETRGRNDGLTTAITNNLFMSTDNICSKGSKQIGTFFEDDDSIYSKESFSEETKDVEVEFQSICDVSKSDLKDEIPFVTGADIETFDYNNVLPLNTGREIVKRGKEELFCFTLEPSLTQGLGLPNIKRLKLKEAGVISEMINPSFQTCKANGHSDFETQCGSSKMHTQFSEEEIKLEQCVKLEHEDLCDTLCSEISHDHHLTLAEKYSVHCADDMQDTMCTYKNNQGYQLQSDTFKLEKRSQCGEKWFLCAVCKLSFPDTYLLKVHRKTHTGEKCFKCDVCERLFSCRSLLKKHMRIHTSEKPFKCNNCKSSFSRLSRLKIHLRTHTGEKPFKCHICDFSCSVKSNIKVHLQTHASEKPFKCDYCQCSFSLKSYLKIHLRIHSDDKPFKCDVCEFSFSRKSNLKVHLRTHTGEKPFKCDYCQSSFTLKCHLQIHLRTHTGEKPFKCVVCELSFSQMGTLRDHLRAHTGEKPFKCDICQSSFRVRSALKTHFRTHSGEKPFKCDYCESSFTQSGNLKRHLRIHAGKKTFK